MRQKGHAVIWDSRPRAGLARYTGSPRRQAKSEACKRHSINLAHVCQSKQFVDLARDHVAPSSTVRYFAPQVLHLSRADLNAARHAVHTNAISSRSPDSEQATRRSTDVCGSCFMAFRSAGGTMCTVCKNVDKEACWAAVGDEKVPPVTWQACCNTEHGSRKLHTSIGACMRCAENAQLTTAECWRLRVVLAESTSTQAEALLATAEPSLFSR